jgi:PHD/YefM family antitoxin component YafN of YafNO toxin-antitoxin module
MGRSFRQARLVRERQAAPDKHITFVSAMHLTFVPILGGHFGTVVLTSRGKPRAILVSIEDYQHLEQEKAAARVAQWEAWLAQSDALAAEILARRGGEPIDVEALLEAVRADREERDAEILGG